MKTFEVSVDTVNTAQVSVDTLNSEVSMNTFVFCSVFEYFYMRKCL